MIDTYEFFDRAAYDRIWGVSWKTLRHRNLGNPWFWPVFEGFDANEDGAGTLHQLLGFSIEPQPTDRQIKGFLKRLKVGETVVRCSPQSFAMSELLQHTIASPERFTLSVELKDPFSFIGIAVQAFLSKRISAASSVVCCEAAQLN
jgi:hypothetical protein